VQFDVGLELSKELHPQAAVVHSTYFDEGINIALQQIQSAGSQFRHEGLFLGIGRNVVVVVVMIVVVTILDLRPRWWEIGGNPWMVQIDIVHLFSPSRSHSDHRRPFHQDSFQGRNLSVVIIIIIIVITVIVKSVDGFFFSPKVTAHCLPTAQNGTMVEASQQTRGAAGLAVLGGGKGLVGLALWIADASEAEDRQLRNLAGSHNIVLLQYIVLLEYIVYCIVVLCIVL